MEGTKFVGGTKLVEAFSLKGPICVGFLVALAGDLVDVRFPDGF